MKAENMLTRFMEMVGQYNLSPNYPLDTDTVFALINDAQDKFIRMVYDRSNEAVSGSKSDLLPITVELAIPVVTNEADLTLLEYHTGKPDFMFLYRIEPIFASDCVVIPEMYEIRHDEINKILTNVFTRPKQGVRFHYALLDKKIRFLTDGDTITAVRVTYIRRPKRITINNPADARFDNELYTNECELLEHTHQPVLDIAVSLLQKPEQQ